MSDLTVIAPRLPAMSEEAMAKVRALEADLRTLPQIPIATHHVLHGGMYARTVMVPAGVVLVGSLLKISTVLIISGEMLIYADDKVLELQGYNVLPGSIGRKQVGVAKKYMGDNAISQQGKDRGRGRKGVY